MRRIILSLLAGLAVSTAALAQFPVQVAVPNAGPSYTPEVPSMDDAPYVGPLWTVDLQYLLYFLKPLHFNSSVVGMSSNPDLFQGNADFVPVVGPGYLDRGPYSGMRLNLTHAAPMDFARTAYFDLVGFWVPHQSFTKRITSTPDGNPSLLLPFTTTETSNLGPAGNYFLLLSGQVPGGGRLSGAVESHTATQAWGGEANLAGPLYQGTCVGLEGLFGFRYFGLNDVFDLYTRTSASGGFVTYDHFSTTNHFYGGQVGLKLIWSSDRWAGMAGAKVGIGDTNNRVSIRGNTVRLDGTAFSQTPGGFYASSTNSGYAESDYFGVLVDLNVGLRFAFSQFCGVSFGYNFVSLSGVLRAGDQVNTTINPAYNAVLNPLGVPPTGPLQPSRPADVSNFWMHGLNFGVDFRF